MKIPARAQLLDHCFVRLDPALTEHAGFELALAPLAEVFERVPMVGEERRHALLTVTEDGGSRTSIAFWAAALQTGLGLASPSEFPWCLANASCASLARRFAVTGPNYTWMVADLGRQTAFAGATEVMSCDLDPAGPDRFAWIMASRFCGPEPGLAVWLWGQGGDKDRPALGPAVLMARDWARQTKGLGPGMQED